MPRRPGAAPLGHRLAFCKRPQLRPALPSPRSPEPRYAPRHARRSARRGPSRLTLTVAAGTVTAFIGVSAGVSLAATASGSTAGPRGVPVQQPAAGHTTPAARAKPAAIAASAQPAPAAGRPAATARPKAKGRRAATSRAGRAKRRRDRRPYLIYDSVIPDQIPAGRVVATYADGPYPASAAETAGATRVLWIDIEGTDTAAQAIDVEPGDASPLAAANWARAKLAADPKATAIIYTSISEWGLIRADVATLPVWMQRQVRWWIADPTGVPHVVPGSQATQWYWGSKYDISTALPDF